MSDKIVSGDLLCLPRVEVLHFGNRLCPHQSLMMETEKVSKMYLYCGLTQLADQNDFIKTTSLMLVVR